MNLYYACCYQPQKFQDTENGKILRACAPFYADSYQRARKIFKRSWDLFVREYFYGNKEVCAYVGRGVGWIDESGEGSFRTAFELLKEVDASTRWEQEDVFAAVLEYTNWDENFSGTVYPTEEGYFFLLRQCVKLSRLMTSANTNGAKPQNNNPSPVLQERGQPLKKLLQKQRNTIIAQVCKTPLPKNNQGDDNWIHIKGLLDILCKNPSDKHSLHRTRDTLRSNRTVPEAFRHSDLCGIDTMGRAWRKRTALGHDVFYLRSTIAELIAD